ncbi:hypothetical protein LB518_09545 [Mesorhizobium sp. BR1-1-16]|nr:hypothetical protein [Mesorhizobium sp. BR1-1-16]MBZ9936538.1 hypothetical protein [Mesorhizobium sp. BR1-1-16]
MNFAPRSATSGETASGAPLRWAQPFEIQGNHQTGGYERLISSPNEPILHEENQNGGRRSMLRRIFLTAALERLVDEGKIKRRSKAFRIMQMVISDGAAVLDDTQRRVYDQIIVPQIEQLERRVS